MLITVLLRRYVLSAEVGSGVRAEGRVGSGAGGGSVYPISCTKRNRTSGLGGWAR
jgi:hypothetical protein